MRETVERVAEAIWQSVRYTESYPPINMAAARDAAKAALMAMRWVTDEMVVEGQIRGFLKEHPGILAAVDWYKPRSDKSITFVNSLSKRIVRDLTCPSSRARLAAVFLEFSAEESSISTVESGHCGETDRHGTLPVSVASSNPCGSVT
jgi:hypothetical protein